MTRNVKKSFYTAKWDKFILYDTDCIKYKDNGKAFSLMQSI